jgi:glycerophosphoryl diester phosphodiesterase
MEKFRPFIHLACLIGLLAPVSAAEPGATVAPVPITAKALIDVRDRAQVRARRPLLIAHRGGVVGPRLPECSLAAIREAAKWGYDMVELDVRETKDGRPVIFHDANLLAACGRDTTISALSEAEARAIRYRKNDEPIASLDEALTLCRTLHLGVMLDLKDRELRPEFLKRIAALVRQHGLERATVTIQGNPLVRVELRSVALVPVTAQELKSIASGELTTAEGLYWFGIPAWIDYATIPKLQRAGALVVPAINLFRYENDPAREQARRDVKQLLAIGVDGFQIDSAYQDFFGRALP